MIKEYAEQWQKNKGMLKEYLKTTPQKYYDSYKELLEKTIELVLNPGLVYQDELDYKHITEADDGDYQGTYMYLIPKQEYQPSANEYIATFAWYGSCCGCDTLLWISEYEDGIPTENQVKQYMLLCLHMVERMKYVYDEDEVFDFLKGVTP